MKHLIDARKPLGTTTFRFPTGRLALAGIAIACSLSAPGASAAFIDKFEAPTLDPFWTPHTESGAISLTTDQAHGGSQSLQLSSFDTGAAKWIWVEHTYAAPVYGTFSVWVDDTGADIGSSNYIQLQVSQAGTDNVGAIGTQDYDLGPGNNGSNYYVNPMNDLVSINTGVDRTQGWHHFVISTTPIESTFQIDGVTVYTAAGAPIDHVGLYMFGPAWRPAWVSYFDDFSATTSVPEPSSVYLAGLALACSAPAARWRTGRRKASAG